MGVDIGDDRSLRVTRLEGKEIKNAGESYKHQIQATHLKGSLSCQTLINDGSYTPEVSFGIVVL